MKSDKITLIPPTPVEQRIIEAASPDLYASDVAELARTNLSSVYRTAYKYGLNLNKFRPGLTDEQKKQLRELASPRTGAKRLAEITGAVQWQIVRFLDQNNLPRKRSQIKELQPSESKEVFCWEDFDYSVI